MKNVTVKNANVEKKTKKTMQCIKIIYYKLKLGLFGRDDKRQGKILDFIVVPQAEQVPKVQKIKA